MPNAKGQGKDVTESLEAESGEADFANPAHEESSYIAPAVIHISQDRQEGDDDDGNSANEEFLAKGQAQEGGSLVPLAAFVFLQSTFSLLVEIATLVLVISNIGIEFLPGIFLGSAVMTIIFIPLGRWFNNRYYPRDCVKWSTFGIIISFVGLWCIFVLFPSEKVTIFLSGFMFMWREVCSRYAVEFFWQMVEERYNIQQAKKVFVFINYIMARSSRCSLWGYRSSSFRGTSLSRQMTCSLSVPSS